MSKDTQLVELDRDPSSLAPGHTPQPAASSIANLTVITLSFTFSTVFIFIGHLGCERLLRHHHSLNTGEGLEVNCSDLVSCWAQRGGPGQGLGTSVHLSVTQRRVRRGGTTGVRGCTCGRWKESSQVSVAQIPHHRLSRGLGQEGRTTRPQRK